MGRSSPIMRYIFIVFLLISFLVGCATDNNVKPKEKTPEELLAEGIAKHENGDYSGAIEVLQTIKDRYPYSKAAVTAELKIADSYYEGLGFDSNYDGTFDAYDEYEKLHPKDKNIPHVMYRKGMCHFKQISTMDRDQTHTRSAKEEFERLVKRFPEDDYAQKAREKIRECLIKLAEHELYVGHFYYKMEKYGPAMERYMFIIKNYPDMGQYHEALEYISICKQKLAEKVE